MTKSAELPILASKHHDEPSAFMPENLLREARRQKGLKDGVVPDVCVLDPDGDIARQTRTAGRAIRDPDWACYHTELYRLTHEGIELGIVPCAVGAPFAVLIAEQLFASGCQLLISVTSSEQLVELRPPPYFILIEKALRRPSDRNPNGPRPAASGQAGLGCAASLPRDKARPRPSSAWWRPQSGNLFPANVRSLRYSRSVMLTQGLSGRDPEEKFLLLTLHPGTDPQSRRPQRELCECRVCVTAFC